jgi:hypothetical protein
MTIETAVYISDLNTANPGSNDQKSEGDDHLRLIKAVLKTTFPNQTSAVITEAINSSNTKIATTAFANPSNSLAASGYVKLPSGLTIQWATVASSAVSDAGWTFPIAFGTAFFTAYGTYVNGGGSGNVLVSIAATSTSGLNFGAYTANTGARVATSCFLLAIGM